MAPLNVDLQQLAAVAAQAADMVRNTGTDLPRGWVQPAGADPISAEAVPRLNSDAATVLNGIVNVLNKVQNTAHDVGAAAVDYSAADAQGAQEIGGSGGSDQSNPVPAIEKLGFRRVPPQLESMSSAGSSDPLTYAQQLHAGPGPGPAMKFAESLRSFTKGPHANAGSAIDGAASSLQDWTPVGADASADLSKYRGWMDQLGSALDMVAENADVYGNAFSAAKAKHPTPEEIIAARKELSRAMRSKDEGRAAAALAKFEEHNARSTEAMGSYAAMTGTGSSGEGGGSGEGSGSNGSQEMNMLSQMLPSLMNMMGTGMDGMPTDEGTGSEEYDDSFDDYGYGGGGIPSAASVSSGGAGVPSAGETESASIGTMAANASTGTGVSGAPRAPVMESSSGSGSGSGSGGAGRGGGMPMMPMGAGAGAGAGAGGGTGERSRIVAWHPDRLMYVDNTPHTEPVIGERPTIAPTVTSPTPAPSNQGSAQTGGTA